MPDELIEEAKRLRAWLESSTMQARYHRPYANPGELRADVRAVVERLERAEREIEGWKRKADNWRDGLNRRDIEIDRLNAELARAALDNRSRLRS